MVKRSDMESIVAPIDILCSSRNSYEASSTTFLNFSFATLEGRELSWKMSTPESVANAPVAVIDPTVSLIPRCRIIKFFVEVDAVTTYLAGRFFVPTSLE